MQVVDKKSPKFNKKDKLDDIKNKRSNIKTYKKIK